MTIMTKEQEERQQFYDQYAMAHGYVNAAQALEARDKIFKTKIKKTSKKKAKN